MKHRLLGLPQIHLNYWNLCYCEHCECNECGKGLLTLFLPKQQYHKYVFEHRTLSLPCHCFLEAQQATVQETTTLKASVQVTQGAGAIRNMQS